MCECARARSRRPASAPSRLGFGPAAPRQRVPLLSPTEACLIILIYSPSPGPLRPRTPLGWGAEQEVYISIIYANRAAAVIGEELDDSAPSIE